MFVNCGPIFFFYVSDINECLADPGPCRPLATCTNTVGSFVCNCGSGFCGDGITSCLGNYTTNLIICFFNAIHVCYADACIKLLKCAADL